MPPKPTLLIVPETWCTPSLYVSLSRPLERLGYRVRTSFLPSTGDRPVCKRGKEDIETLAQTIRYCADRGEDILIVAHGPGAAAAGDAVAGLSKVDRINAGRRGGVIGIAFIAGLVLDVGECVEGMFDGSRRDWVETRGEGCDLADANDFLAGLEADIVESNKAKLKPSALSTRRVETEYAGWRHVPCSYLLCERDSVLEVEHQEAIVIGRLQGPLYDVERLDSGHFPFLDKRWLDFTIGFVRRAAGERV